MTADPLLDFASTRLAGSKVPRGMEFVDELPRSEAGKPLRRILKERYRSRPVPVGEHVPSAPGALIRSGDGRAEPAQSGQATPPR